MKKDWKAPCQRCDECGGAKTYANQVAMPLNGKVQCIDHCIHHIIAALNAGGVRTYASCCGHQNQPGSIWLEDGRDLVILPDQSMLYDIPDNSACNRSLWQILTSALQKQQNGNS